VSKAETRIETYDLAEDLGIVRILNGMWQVAGGHGYIDKEQAIEEMIAYHNAGFTSWDLADIYGPAEDLVGQFRSRLALQKGSQELQKVKALTKWVPEPRPVSRAAVSSSIDRSLSRMHVDSIDLLQFHWWDYNNPYYIDAAKFLLELCNQGKVKHVGLTNFDTERMEIIEKDAGVEIVSNQVQYSIVDRRPEIRMTRYCAERRAGGRRSSILAYGTLCGGLMSEKYLGKPEPRGFELATPSLQKYKRMIDAWGGWKLFLELLATLDDIAKRHKVGIANVATRYILDKASVAGVIIGARLGISEHREENLLTFGLELSDDDNKNIQSVCDKSEDLYDKIGDCGDEYRH
jgi:aryl-alcohol dehydrogenase-like predicted oxidoreductase